MSGDEKNLTTNNDAIRRRNDEGAVEYLHRVVLDYLENQKKERGNLVGKIQKNFQDWASPDIIRAFERNAELARSLIRSRDLQRAAAAAIRSLPKGIIVSPALIEQKPIVDAVRLPSNPAFETNKRLDALLARFGFIEQAAGQTIELVTTMNEAAVGLLQRFTEGARATERFSRRTIWIAIIALFVAAATPIGSIGYDYVKSQRQQEDTRQTVEQVLQRLTDSQSSAADKIDKSLSIQAQKNSGDRDELVSAIHELVREIRALRESRSKSAQ